jgi:molybdate transport system ATP-binding protein
VISVDVQFRRPAFTLDVVFESDARLLGVFGPSGAGKTTLITLIAGLERPDGGAIALDGKALFDGAGGVDLASHRRRVGVVFQESRLFPHYSVRGNLLYGARRGSDELQSIAKLLEIESLLARRIGQLSGGERQRVALGRALLSDPQVLLLDEPLASLDYRLRQQILPYLRRLTDVVRVPVLYVSHELQEILQLTDQLLVLEAGRVAGQGKYAELVHEDRVLNVVHDRGMTNMLRARVLAHRADDGVSVLGVEGAMGQRDRVTEEAGQGSAATGTAQLLAPLAAQMVGEVVTVSVQPWDIALAGQPIEGVSIQNQLRGVVKHATTHDRRVLVEVDIGASVVVVEISRRSALAMNIQPGRVVYCLIKSHAIRCTGAGESPVFREPRA